MNLRTPTVYILVIPCILVIGILLIGFFFPWTHFWCSETEIDIHSGRVRESKYFLAFKLGETCRDTELTKSLPSNEIALQQPSWKPVITLSPGTDFSPQSKYNNFHDAISQINVLTEIWKAYQFDTNAQRETARNVLRLWQAYGDDKKANMYVFSLHYFFENRIKKATQAQLIVHAEDLPTTQEMNAALRGMEGIID